MAATLAVAFGAWVPICQAATHALLIGVSGYPTLPEQRRLKGPANDVQLLRAALLKIGVPPQQIEVLADTVPGSAGLPTRQAILASMDQLGQRAKSGDWVVLYFSGHGSQQPQTVRPGVSIEPDGLDEIFLPYDVGTWDPTRKVVQGAIIDDEIGDGIAKLTSRQVNVWAIFDTCHAGDMAKGTVSLAGGPVTRFVAPTALGVPNDKVVGGVAIKRRKSGDGTSKGMQLPSPVAAGPASERLVAFYASHADEPAAEESLAVPAELARTGGGAEPRRYFGLFTYLIAEALRSPPASFRRLAQQLTERYKARPYPTPLFEGPIDKSPDFFPRRP
jgi:hypothetical protein